MNQGAPATDLVRESSFSNTSDGGCVSRFQNQETLVGVIKGGSRDGNAISPLTILKPLTNLAQLWYLAVCYFWLSH